MKETPPVLTAGPAAWIADRGRKREHWLVGTAPSRAAGGQKTLRDGRGTCPRTTFVCALCPSPDRKHCGLCRPGIAVWEARCGTGTPASTAPPGECPVRRCLRLIVAQGPRDAEVSYGLRLCDYTSQIHRPSSPKSPPTPTHGNIRSHLARRGVACATFGDTRGTGWSQPHLDAFLKLRPA